MSVINFRRKEIIAKVVYYGPALSGKTTNVKKIHESIPATTRGELTSLPTEEDRTLFFDFIPLHLGNIGGFKTRFQIFTVPGQTYYSSTRRVVLQSTDGVVFVADSSPDAMERNLESLADLRQNLLYHDKFLNAIPFVIQYNKRDVPGALSLEQLERELNLLSVPSFPATALVGEGVRETLSRISSLVLTHLKASIEGRLVHGRSDPNLIEKFSDEDQSDEQLVRQLLAQIHNVRRHEAAEVSIVDEDDDVATRVMPLNQALKEALGSSPIETLEAEESIVLSSPSRAEIFDARGEQPEAIIEEDPSDEDAGEAPVGSDMPTAADFTAPHVPPRETLQNAPDELTGFLEETTADARAAEVGPEPTSHTVGLNEATATLKSLEPPPPVPQTRHSLAGRSSLEVPLSEVRAAGVLPDANASTRSPDTTEPTSSALSNTPPPPHPLPSTPGRVVAESMPVAPSSPAGAAIPATAAPAQPSPLTSTPRALDPRTTQEDLRATVAMAPGQSPYAAGSLPSSPGVQTPPPPPMPSSPGARGAVPAANLPSSPGSRGPVSQPGGSPMGEPASNPPSVPGVRRTTELPPGHQHTNPPAQEAAPAPLNVRDTFKLPATIRPVPSGSIQESPSITTPLPPGLVAAAVQPASAPLSSPQGNAGAASAGQSGVGKAGNSSPGQVRPIPVYGSGDLEVVDVGQIVRRGNDCRVPLTVRDHATGALRQLQLQLKLLDPNAEPPPTSVPPFLMAWLIGLTVLVLFAIWLTLN